MDQPTQHAQKSGDVNTAPTVLFDGVCNLCNGFVNFIIDHDATEEFHFGSLQSPRANALLDRAETDLQIDPDALDSVILVENDDVYTRSTAVLRVLLNLGLPWSLLYALIGIPKSVRDWIYERVAANRYSWFGRRSECRVPTPELKNRFID